MVRAPASHAGGHRFESCRAHHSKKRLLSFHVGRYRWRKGGLGQSDDAIQIALAPVGLVQAYSAAAVVPFNFVKTAVEKAGNRLRTANYFDGKCRCVLFHVYLR